ncbi:hypothetical protein JX266_005418 [Neoarthrinium moseri]|nr:hypothetical protein JX266_005418 [Neoarthrinium moseri]
MHRMRRAPINRFLSRAQMLKLEAEVHEFTQRMCDKMLRTWGPFDVKEVYNCYTADIISQYTFGDDMKALMNELNITIPGQIQRALDKKESGRMFTDLIESDQLPEAEKTIFRLSGEGSTILAAGESPLNLKWTDLEQRPDLWAVIYEALRFTPGISHRPARIAREEDLFYKSENGKAQWVQSLAYWWYRYAYGCIHTSDEQLMWVLLWPSERRTASNVHDRTEQPAAEQRIWPILSC